MGGRGAVAVVEEASCLGETGGVEVDSPPSYGMVCRKAPIVQTACCCVICVWLAYICRRRLTCLLAMDRRGTVAVVEDRGVLTRRNRRYRGRLSAIIWYGV